MTREDMDQIKAIEERTDCICRSVLDGADDELLRRYMLELCSLASQAEAMLHKSRMVALETLLYEAPQISVPDRKTIVEGETREEARIARYTELTYKALGIIYANRRK